MGVGSGTRDLKQSRVLESSVLASGYIVDFGWFSWFPEPHPHERDS